MFSINFRQIHVHDKTHTTTQINKLSDCSDPCTELFISLFNKQFSVHKSIAFIWNFQRCALCFLFLFLNFIFKHVCLKFYAHKQINKYSTDHPYNQMQWNNLKKIVIVSCDESNIHRLVVSNQTHRNTRLKLKCSNTQT